MNNFEFQKKDICRFKARISGKVQGVFFRDFTLKEANDLNIFGWVRNTDDGCVEVVAEGYKKNLDKLIEFLKEGSPKARVDSVDIKWEEPKGEKDFIIKF